jgi:hypothetical protein
MRRTSALRYKSAAKADSMTTKKPTDLVSPEAEVIQQIEELIRRIATGEASPKDMELLYELQQRRIDMMQSKELHSGIRVSA